MGGVASDNRPLSFASLLKLLDRVRPKTTAQFGLVLFVSLVVVYHANATLMDEGDATPNLNLPTAILTRGSFSFTPDDFPEMFLWKSSPPLIESDDFFIRRWHFRVGDKSVREWKDEGFLVLRGPRYHLVESPRRHVHVSTFGPIPGITFLPLSALIYAIDHSYGENAPLVLSAGKLHGSLLIAASALFLFLMALGFTSRGRALLLAVAYGVGTCAWAIASQNVWQQTVNTFFICLGCLFFLRNPDDRRLSAASGAAFGVAMACRHTSAIMVAFIALYLLRYHRKSAYSFALGVLPVPVAIGFYNFYYFGSPFSFGQEIIGHQMALTKTGSPDLWQTPFYIGALGLLASPSRGLLVFSPFLAFSGLGMLKIWLDARYRALRPLTIATVLVMALQCKWFDWWGGWAYGYRPWLDAVPLLILFLVPVIDWIWEGSAKRLVFSSLLAWSCFVQFIGAFAYDKAWNERMLYVMLSPGQSKPSAYFTQAEAEALAKSSGGSYLGPTNCNIDHTYCRYRLWSIRDNMIAYYVAHFSEARKHRFDSGWRELALFRN